MIALEVADWRRRVFALYAAVRAESDPLAAHALWRRTRDDLFATHPATPLLPEDRPSFAGLPVTDYDPAWRFELEIVPGEPRRMDVETGTDGVVPFGLLGTVDIPQVGTLDVWRLASYGGGFFCPSRMRFAANTAEPMAADATCSTPLRAPTSARVPHRTRSCSTSTSRTTRRARTTRRGLALSPSRETPSP
jgi:hypothetical protein